MVIAGASHALRAVPVADIDPYGAIFTLKCSHGRQGKHRSCLQETTTSLLLPRTPGEAS